MVLDAAQRPFALGCQFRELRLGRDRPLPGTGPGRRPPPAGSRDAPLRASTSRARAAFKLRAPHCRAGRARRGGSRSAHPRGSRSAVRLDQPRLELLAGGHWARLSSASSGPRSIARRCSNRRANRLRLAQFWQAVSPARRVAPPLRGQPGSPRPAGGWPRRGLWLRGRRRRRLPTSRHKGRFLELADFRRQLAYFSGLPGLPRLRLASCASSWPTTSSKPRPGSLRRP